jgi:hypothetical protein
MHPEEATGDVERREGQRRARLLRIAIGQEDFWCVDGYSWSTRISQPVMIVCAAH